MRFPTTVTLKTGDRKLAARFTANDGKPVRWAHKLWLVQQWSRYCETLYGGPTQVYNFELREAVPLSKPKNRRNPR